jgi:hypothetical protein
LKSVTAAGLDAVRLKATPWTLTGETWFSSAEELRTVAAKLLGAASSTSSASASEHAKLAPH